MSESTNPPVTADEKMMAAVAHFFGLIAALILWAYQKDKSRFVKFQSLQALSFDFVIVVGISVFLFCIFGAVFVGFFGSMFAMFGNTPSPENLSPFFMATFMFPFTIFACVMPLGLAVSVIRIIASISVLNGHDFRYPVLGKWLERFLAG